MKVFCRDTSFDIVYDVIEPGRAVIYEDQGLTVETFPLYHRVDCVGFKFTEKPKLRHLRGDIVSFYNIPVSQLPLIKEGADYVTPDGTVIANERLTTDADPSMSYAYCSDTAFNPAIADDIAGIDTVYHESTYCSDQAAKASARGHSTAAEAARIARMAGARRLILGHFSKSYRDSDVFVKEAAAIFPNVIAADEGLRIDLL